MTAVQTMIDAPLAEVWETLVDARTYPEWLIGARKIRSVDDGWPAPGTAFHHTVGLGGPLTISDRTRSVAVEPQRSLVLDVRARPFVHARVHFDLRSADGGTQVTMEEHPVGLHRIAAPVLGPMTKARNKGSLEKLQSCLRRRSGSGA